MEIYLFDEYSSVTDAALTAMIQSMPEYRQQKARRYRFRRDRLSCAAAYRLLTYGLKHSRGIADFTLAVSANGKPYLADRPKVHFSLSHCPLGCICVLSDSEVGGDIQDITYPGEAVVKAVCSEAEAAAVRSSDDPARAFTRIWAMKEAYLKMLGTGITDDLKAADTTALGRITVIDRGSSIIAAVSSGGDDAALIPVSLSALTEDLT